MNMSHNTMNHKLVIQAAAPWASTEAGKVERHSVDKGCELASSCTECPVPFEQCTLELKQKKDFVRLGEIRNRKRKNKHAGG